MHWPKARRGARREGFGAFWPPRPEDAEEKEETSQDIEPYLYEAVLDAEGCWHTLPMQVADFEDALLSGH